MAERIKERRISMGYTQEELANKLGLQKSAIAKYENGRVENIKRSVIINMANVLECSPTYLMGWEDNDSDSKNQKPIIRIVPRPDCKINFDKLQVALDKCSANKLNEKGTEELIKFIIERMMEHSEMLSKIPEYQAVPLLNAAHANDYATASEKLKKLEEDIMDDENF